LEGWGPLNFGQFPGITQGEGARGAKKTPPFKRRPQGITGNGGNPFQNSPKKGGVFEPEKKGGRTPRGEGASVLWGGNRFKYRCGP